MWQPSLKLQPHPCLLWLILCTLHYLHYIKFSRPYSAGLGNEKASSRYYTEDERTMFKSNSLVDLGMFWCKSHSHEFSWWACHSAYSYIQRSTFYLGSLFLGANSARCALPRQLSQNHITSKLPRYIRSQNLMRRGMHTPKSGMKHLAKNLLKKLAYLENSKTCPYPRSFEKKRGGIGRFTWKPTWTSVSFCEETRQF